MRKAFTLAVGVGAMLISGPAFAGFHEMKIVEVYAGSATAPNAHYVQLQMYNGGQVFLGGHSIVVYNAAGGVTGTVNLAQVNNGTTQATILIGTADVMASFGVAPDFVLPTLTPAGGKVCFDADPGVDCFSWGNYNGSLTSTTAPFAALGTGSAAQLTIAGGNSALLDIADDTGSSLADYAAGTPLPKNNLGAVGAGDGGAPVLDSGVPPAGDAAAPMDSGTTPGVDSGTNPGTDSGVGTTPTPPREGGASGDDASTNGAGGDSSDDSGCSLGTHPADASIAGLALVGIASMIAFARRRRRSKR